MLPSDFPSLRTVHEYFRIWSNRKEGENKSLLETLLTEIVGYFRLIDGRQQKTSFVIIEALGVKNSDTAIDIGYDAGKKVSGIKRHIAVDTQGLPHAIHITTANITDREGALEAFKSASSSLSNVVNVLADGGYTGEKFASKVKEIIGADVEIAKRNELHTFEVIPKRWVVERSFAWLEKCRRLWKNCERKLETSYLWSLLLFSLFFSKDIEQALRMLALLNGWPLQRIDSV
jgi:transposase